jgi:hypothetical protein
MVKFITWYIYELAGSRNQLQVDYVIRLYLPFNFRFSIQKLLTPMLINLSKLIPELLSQTEVERSFRWSCELTPSNNCCRGSY